MTTSQELKAVAGVYAKRLVVLFVVVEIAAFLGALLSTIFT